ncbi:MAG: glycosyltransferase family 39 protein [Acidobacteria bacterium]|nr:glycosyltransferase family 39 protein [Acidobacteriota bacterium]
MLKTKRGAAEAAGVAALLLILGLQLFMTVRQQSQTWDEADHIFAGYMSWKTADFGLNPEHPPLVKLIAALPLLPMPLTVPALQDRFFKENAFLSGKDFLYRNDADAILLRARSAAAVFSLLGALFVFLGTREMFGRGAAFFALALLVFDPNFLAHGAYVTTDAGASAMIFATVYAFYRWVKAPSAPRLLLVGLALGVALAVKHSAVLLFPMLFVLALGELLRRRFGTRDTETEAPVNLWKQALRMMLALAAITAIGVVLLWACYGFRYQARPAGLELNPPFAEFTKGLTPGQDLLIGTAARFHLLPESYLYGLSDILMTTFPSYVFGKTYPHSVWFYFSVVFVVKSTLALLLLFLLTLAAIGTRRFDRWREVLFLGVPPLIYFLAAMNSGTNIGVRHILPVYIFLFALAGGAAAAFVGRHRKWGFVAAALLIWHVAASLLAYPYYIPYSNELWGGSVNTWKHLSDSNADWAQQLKEVKRYLDARGIKDCWFVYFGEGVAEPAYYGIPCRPLPTADSLWLNERIAPPPAIDGPVLVSAADLSGFEFGPGRLNPYEDFKSVTPNDVIGRQVFVFEGRFEIPLAAALGRSQNARNLLEAEQTDAALAEAQTAAALAPDSVTVRITLGDALSAAGRRDEARAEYQRALTLAQTVEPDFQAGAIPSIEQKLAGN